MIVECAYCESDVEAQELGQHEEFDRDDIGPARYTLVACPKCKRSLLAGQELLSVGDDAEEWAPPMRLWPRPRRRFDFAVPDDVRISLREADRCLRAKAYLACAAMASRALEGVCRHFKGSREYVAPGLKELHKRKLIDDRLFQWSEQLNAHREVAANGTEGTVSRHDAEDLLDLVSAICEYVFLFGRRFEQFMERRNARQKQQAGPVAAAAKPQAAAAGAKTK
jgi:hypothetical protein